MALLKKESQCCQLLLIEQIHCLLLSKFQNSQIPEITRARQIPKFTHWLSDLLSDLWNLRIKFILGAKLSVVQWDSYYYFHSHNCQPWTFRVIMEKLLEKYQILKCQCTPNFWLYYSSIKIFSTFTPNECNLFLNCIRITGLFYIIIKHT